MTLRTIGYAAVVAVSAAAFVLGSAATGEAKSKKKTAEAAPPPPTCLLSPAKAVCGAKGGMKFTYNSACYATKDGAKVVADKACSTKAAKLVGKKKKKAKM